MSRVALSELSAFVAIAEHRSDIVDAGLDAGIRVHEDVPKDMLIVQFSREMRFTTVASVDYVSRHGQPSSLLELKQHRCVSFSFAGNAPSPWTMKQDDKLVEVAIDGQVTVGNLNLAVDCALAGLGIGCVPESHVRDHIGSGRLVTLLEEYGTSIPGLCLYFPANRHLPTAMRLFVDAVRAWANLQTS